MYGLARQLGREVSAVVRYLDGCLVEVARRTRRSVDSGSMTTDRDTLLARMDALRDEHEANARALLAIEAATAIEISRRADEARSVAPSERGRWNAIALRRADLESQVAANRDEYASLRAALLAPELGAP